MTSTHSQALETIEAMKDLAGEASSPTEALRDARKTGMSLVLNAASLGMSPEIAPSSQVSALCRDLSVTDAGKKATWRGIARIATSERTLTGPANALIAVKVAILLLSAQRKDEKMTVCPTLNATSVNNLAI